MAATPLQPGDPALIGPYRVVGRLGQGGQGVVFLGVRQGADEEAERVAIKVLHAMHAADPEARRRFLREIETARQVAEFCTARVLDVGETGDALYVVSEYIEGPSLQKSVRADGPRQGTALHRIAVGTATALAAIHQAGVVHRDFKPGNVLLGPDGPRVIDFGIARALDVSTTTSSGVIGTPAYMSPEQIRGERVGPASDIFAWAGTMVFAATGRPPFEGGSIPAVLHRVLSGEPDLSGVPENLRPILAACFAKDPAARPTASELLMRLIAHPAPDRAASPPAGPPERDDASPGTLPPRGGPPATVPPPLEAVPEHRPAVLPAPGPHSPAAPRPGPHAPGGTGHAPAPPRVTRPLLVAFSAVTAVLVTLVVLVPSWGTPRGDATPTPEAVITDAAFDDATPGTGGSSPAPAPTPAATTAPPPSTAPVNIDANTGKAVGRPLRGHTDDVYAVAVAEVNGRQVVVSGASDRTVRLWDLKSRRPLARLTGHTGWVRDIAVAQVGGQTVAVSVSHDRTLRMWDLTARRAFGAPIRFSQRLYSVAVATLDGRTVAIVGGAGRLWIYDLATRERIGRPIEAHSAVIFNIAVAETAQGTRVFTASGDGTVRMWDPGAGPEQEGVLVSQSAAQINAVTTAELDGRLVVIAAGGDQVITVNDPWTGAEVRAPIGGHDAWIYCLAAVRVGDGVVLASGGNSATARVNDLATGEPVGRPFGDHEHNVNGIAVVEHDGRLVAVTAGGDNNLRVWRIT